MNEMNGYNILKNECFWLKEQLKAAQKSETELKELMFNECYDYFRWNDYNDSKGYESWDWSEIIDLVFIMRD